ncbi:MAG: hypothetical protein DRI77_12365 [Chloroflexi bacterium]|nr:MAG: hypothetical protein DRI77_12365 [Chloroflexota bacterium]
MKAAVLYAPREIRFEEVPDPTPGPGEVLIRVRACGVCGSDLHIYTGDREVGYPRILGHEFAGEVVAVGEGVSGIAPGERVTAEPNFSCGHCYYCRAGLPNLCLKRVGLAIHLDGSFAELVKVPAAFVWKLPEGVSYRQGAMVEPLMVAWHAVRRGGVSIGDRVAVLGCGAIGLLVTMVAAAAGARVYTVDIVPHKLTLARQLGAFAAFNGREVDAVEEIRRATDGLGADVVFETAGVATTVEQALEAVRQAGRVVLVGLSTQPARLVPMSVARREVQIIGSFTYYADEFAIGIRLIASGRLDVESLIGFTTDLAGTAEAFRRVEAGEVVKAMVEM